MTLFERVRRWHRLLHRYTSYRTEVGLRRVGNPGPEAPVLVTGNFEHTVERLEEILAGYDVWLLVADSAGINVWCAAGVGDFDENKIIDVVEATGLADLVRHRQLVLPPLAAVGIDRERLAAMTGFRVVWGPAHFDDLPAFLAQFPRCDPAMKLVCFPVRDRLEMGVGMMGVFSFPLLLAWWWPRQVLWFMGSVAHAVFGTLLAYDRLPPKYPANKAALIGALQLIAIWITRRSRWPRLPLWQRFALGGWPTC